MQQFETLNRQQQPFIQSGYGAMGKLNTLLGIGGRQMNSPMPLGGNAALMPRGGANAGQTYRPRPNGGMQQIVASGASRPVGGSRLSQILMLRAANGDTEAQRVLGQM
jgi:hypothetical protein